jgi:hypothetical protein
MADQYSTGMTQDVERRGNVALGFIAGLIAAIIGALIWMGVDVGMNMHLGIVAIAIGFLVGFAIRFGGHGASPLFGVMGALLTLGSCFAGDMLARLYAQVSPEHDFYNIATTADYSQLSSAIISGTQPMGWVIYAIALYEGYKLSIAK